MFFFLSRLICATRTYLSYIRNIVIIYLTVRNCLLGFFGTLVMSKLILYYSKIRKILLCYIACPEWTSISWKCQRNLFIENLQDSEFVASHRRFWRGDIHSHVIVGEIQCRVFSWMPITYCRADGLGSSRCLTFLSWWRSRLQVINVQRLIGPSGRCWISNFQL